jgi:RNA polymerase sigma factor (sigma-70 family)
MATLDLEDVSRRALAGDLAARDALIEELLPLVVRTVRLIVGSGSELAEDAAQDAVTDVLRGLDRLREPRAVRAWATKIATRRAVRAARGERLRRTIRIADVPADPAVAPGPEWLDVRGAFYSLPPRMRAVAVVRLYCGFGEVDTARILGCAVGTVKSQLAQARVRLRASLEPLEDEP